MVLFAIFWTPVTFAKNFTILTGEWAPYVSEALPGGGPIADIVSEAMKAAGHTVTFEYTTWKRTEVMTQEGKAVATFPWGSTDKFVETCYHSTPLFTVKTVFFFLKDKHPSWDFTSVDELKQLTIGGIKGYSYLPVLLEAGVKVSYAPTLDKSMKKLINGRVDVVPESSIVGWQMLKDKFLGDVGKVAASKTPLSTNPDYLMISKSHPEGKEFHDAFEKGFKSIKESGRYQEIMEASGLN